MLNWSLFYSLNFEDWSSFILSLNQRRVPSNLRPTTHEFVHLVTRGHFRSRGKYGGHIIRSAIAENPCWVIADRSLHHRNRSFRTLLLLWPDDLHIRIWPVFHLDILDVQIWTCYVKAFERYRLTDRHTNRQTRPTLYTTPLRGWSKNCARPTLSLRIARHTHSTRSTHMRTKNLK